MGANTEANRDRSTFAFDLRLLLNMLFCGFGAVGVLPGYYPTGIAAVLALLLTYC
jgi:hypothetical protein